MRKLILLFLLLTSLSASAQWVGGTTQGIFTGNKQLRGNFGSSGFIYWYSKGQIDSLFATVAPGALTFTNPLLKTGTVVSLLTDVTPTSLSIKPLTSGGAFTALAGKQNTITTGTISQYFRGDLSLATFPTIYSFSGNTSQYTRGDGTYATLNTTVVPEGTNLYWTPTRFNTAFSGKTSDDLTEGSTNLYYTAARSALKADKTTTISASGNGIMGGGSLAANRSVSLDFNFLDARYAVSGTTLNPLTNGFGVNTFSFNGSAAQSVVIDTANITSKEYFNTRIGVATATSIATKQNIIALGTTAQYFRGDLSLATFPTGLPPTGAAGGDLTGTYPNPTVNTINSITKSYYDPTSSIQTQFNSKIGLTSLSATAPLSYNNSTGVFSIQVANTSQNGYLSSTDWNTFNNKEPLITAGTNLQYYRGDKTFQTLNTAAVPELTNLYYTDTRARTALSFTAGSGAYNSTTGVIAIPTNNNQIANGAGYGTGTVTNVSSANTDIAVATGTTTPVLTLNNVNGITKSYYDPTSSIQTQLNSKEVPLTFNNGLTRTSNTVTNDLTTGISTGQSVNGGVSSGSLTLSPFTSATSIQKFVIDANGLTGGGGVSANSMFRASATITNPASSYGGDFTSVSSLAATVSANTFTNFGIQGRPTIGSTNTQNWTNASGALVGLVGQTDVVANTNTFTVASLYGGQFTVRNLSTTATVTGAVNVNLRGFTTTGAITNKTYLWAGTGTIPTGDWGQYWSTSVNHYFGNGVMYNGSATDNGSGASLQNTGKLSTTDIDIYTSDLSASYTSRTKIDKGYADAHYGAIYTPSALTKTDDTNVTLTLGGAPTTSLLQPTSLTLGWSGQLGSTRGGSGINNAGTLTWGAGGTLGTAAYTPATSYISNQNTVQSSSSLFVDGTNYTGTFSTQGASRPDKVKIGTSGRNLLYIENNGTQSTTGGGQIIIAANNAAAMASGSRLGNISYYGFDGGANRETASIDANAEALWVASTSYPTYLAFFTTSTTARTERMRLSSAGVLSLNNPSYTASQLLSLDASKNLVNVTALPSGTTATTQSANDNSTKVATTAYVDAGDALKLTNPMTTLGDIIYSSSGSTAARLGIGGANTVLHGGTIPSYSAIVQGDVTNGFVDLTSTQSVGGNKTFTGANIYNNGQTFNNGIISNANVVMGNTKTVNYQNGAGTLFTSIGAINPTTTNTINYPDASGTVDLGFKLRLTGSGTGAATTISIAHGLSGVTSASIALVQPINAASAGVSYVTTDATNINIVYTVAPILGTSNLSYNVSIKP